MCLLLWRTWHEANAIPANVRSWRFLRAAALPLALGEEDVFKKRGLKLHNFYGSSECGGIAYDATDVPRANRLVWAG